LEEEENGDLFSLKGLMQEEEDEGSMFWFLRENDEI